MIFLRKHDLENRTQNYCGKLACVRRNVLQRSLLGTYETFYVPWFCFWILIASICAHFHVQCANKFDISSISHLHHTPKSRKQVLQIIWGLILSNVCKAKTSRYFPCAHYLMTLIWCRFQYFFYSSFFIFYFCWLFSSHFSVMCQKHKFFLDDYVLRIFELYTLLWQQAWGMAFER